MYHQLCKVLKCGLDHNSVAFAVLYQVYLVCMIYTAPEIFDKISINTFNTDLFDLF